MNSVNNNTNPSPTEEKLSKLDQAKLIFYKRAVKFIDFIMFIITVYILLTIIIFLVAAGG